MRTKNLNNAIVFCGIFYTTKMQFVAQQLEMVIPISIFLFLYLIVNNV